MCMQPTLPQSISMFLSAAWGSAMSIEYLFYEQVCIPKHYTGVLPSVL